MNDWPADPKLDSALRDLVDVELAAARTSPPVVAVRPRVHRRAELLALTAVALVAVVAVAAPFASRGTAPAIGQGGPTPSHGDLGGTTPTPGVTEAARTPVAPTPALVPTPGPIVTGGPKAYPTPSLVAPSAQFHAIATPTTSGGQAVLLRDGRVLIVCGSTPTVDFAAAELYDPATGRFTPTGSLHTGRYGATVTLLADGRVLVAGGIDSTYRNQPAQAEIYDPATGTFSPTGSLHTSRQYHTASLLSDGRVLIAGGTYFGSLATAGTNVLASVRRAGQPPDAPAWATDRPLNSAELYDPKTGQFTPAPTMKRAMSQHTATQLADGRVLLVGSGGESTGASAAAQIYDPKTGAFSVTGSTRQGRWLHTATLLADGRVLVSGGRTSDDGIRQTAELYDPKTGRFTLTGSMTMTRQQFTATLLPDGRVLVAGCWSLSTPTANSVQSAELYDPKTGTFAPAGMMTAARASHTATLLPDGSVLIAGGDFVGPNGGELIYSAELYRP